MSLNNKSLIIIIASLFIFVACATGVIIYSVNSHLDNKEDIATTHKQLRSLMYNNKYAELDVNDPQFALDIGQQSLNLIATKFKLPQICRTFAIKSSEIRNNFTETQHKIYKIIAKEQCVPTYKLIKENFSDIKAFNEFMEAMEFYVPELKK